jgi:hypothetical protein
MIDTSNALIWRMILPIGGTSLRVKLLRRVQASISVPSTVKCSSDSNPRARPWATTRSKNAWATPPSSSRCRFLVNTVAA